MYSFNKYESQSRYDEWNTVQIKLKLNQKTDADILEWARQQKYGRSTSIQGSIKKLKSQEIAKNNEPTGLSTAR